MRNEIAVLKRVSAGHPNIVSLHDFFETTHNLYVSAQCDDSLCHLLKQLSLCLTCALEESSLTGSAQEAAITRSESQSDVHAMGSNWSVVADRLRDAQNIVRTVTHAVKYLHDQGIVHRGQSQHCPLITDSSSLIVDLKPENILFKDKSEDAELALADFGVSLTTMRLPLMAALEGARGGQVLNLDHNLWSESRLRRCTIQAEC